MNLTLFSVLLGLFVSANGDLLRGASLVISNATVASGCYVQASCNSNGIQGNCVSRSSGCCAGTFNSANLCPGNDDVQVRWILKFIEREIIFKTVLLLCSLPNHSRRWNMHANCTLQIPRWCSWLWELLWWSGWSSVLREGQKINFWKQMFYHQH